MLTWHKLLMQRVVSAPASGISIVGTATGSGATPSYTVTLPAGRQTGDFVLVITVAAELDDGAGSYTPPASHPTISGYTVQATSTLAGGYTRSAVYWKRLTAADASLTVTNGSAQGTAATVYVLRGVHATTAFDVAVGVAGSGNNGVANPPSITPVTAGALVFAGAVLASQSPGLSSAPTGYTNLSATTLHYAARLYVGAALASKVWAGGAENPAAYPGGGVNFSDMGTGYTIAIRPA